MKLYQAVAGALQAQETCLKRGNDEWHSKHWDRIAGLVAEHMPSGAGFDNGTRLCETSTQDKLIFNSEYHMMNDGGYYDGWLCFQVAVTASMVFGYELTIHGLTAEDGEAHGDYIHEVFSSSLDTEITDN